MLTSWVARDVRAINVASSWSLCIEIPSGESRERARNIARECDRCQDFFPERFRRIARTQTRDLRLCAALSITERRRVAEYPAHPPRDPGWQVVGNNPAIGRPPRERNPRLIAAAAVRYRDTSLPCIRETRWRGWRGRRRWSELATCPVRTVTSSKRRDAN